MAELSSGAVHETSTRSHLSGLLRPSFIACSVVLFIMALIILYPMLLLIYASFLVPVDGTEPQLGFGLWLTAWGQSGILQAVLNTFQRVIVTEVIAFPTAILVTWLITRTDLPGKKLLDVFFWVAFFLPALPVLMGWILLFDPQYGLANQLAKWTFGLRESPFNIYTFSGIVFAHLAARSIAAKYIFLAPAFRNVSSSMEEASHVCGGSALATVRKIVVPLLMPAFLITLCISLIHSLESFEIELILGPPTGFYVFSTKIYQLIAEDPPLFGAATVLGLAILLSMMPLILWQQYLSHTRSFVTVTSQFGLARVRLHGWRIPAFVCVLIFACLITIVPIVFLLLGTFMRLYGYFGLENAWTLQHWNTVLTDGPLISAVINTLIMGGSAALIGVFWFSLIAYISVRTRYVGRGAIDFLSWLPASLPGVVLGLALLWTFLNVPFLHPIYGTMLALVIACMLNSVSTGVQLIKGNMVQLGRELEEASFISGGSWLYTFRRVVIPLLAPVLVSVALLTFIAAARNVSTIAMLVTGDTRPLAMLQVDYMIDGSFEAAAVSGVMIVALTFGVAVFARVLAARLGFTGLAR